jgi:hypothetical protein
MKIGDIDPIYLDNYLEYFFFKKNTLVLSSFETNPEIIP